jgi:hypothetical protein
MCGWQRRRRCCSCGDLARIIHRSRGFAFARDAEIAEKKKERV